MGCGRLHRCTVAAGRVEPKKGTFEPAVLSFWSPAIVIIMIIVIIMDGKSFLDDEMKLPCRWVDMTVVPD